MSRRQQSLRFPDKNGQFRGGKRRGAGRPKQGKRASERHEKRPRLTGREPILVTVRVAPAVGQLRRWRVYHAIRRALATSLSRTDFRVVHISIQRTHLHLVTEAASHVALAKGMQGLLVSAARKINAASHRRGTVFPDRYHERVITSPRQCRHAIAYVLSNFRRHREDQIGGARSWTVDPMSSAVNFGGWRELASSQHRFDVPPWYERLPTSSPETWLLRVGWERHGKIATHAVPGPVAS